MAIGDARGAEVELGAVALDDADAVRHFDQLDDDEQHAFLRLLRGDEPAAVPLDAGEVIVFTDCYRVAR